MNARKFVKWAAVASLGLALTAGCSDQNRTGSLPIDPPPAGVNGDAASAPVHASIADPMDVTIYARDEHNMVAPIIVTMEKTQSVAKKALEYMVEGGPAQGHMPSGFSSILPKGTTIHGINVKENKTAVVDFSQEFTGYNIQDERKMLEAVTWTLTSFPTIDQVEIYVDGHKLTEMPHNGTPLDGSLSREMGINLEISKGVNVGQSTPVTLYFLSENQAGESYYVPVTRLISRTEELEKAVIEQLIAGPDEQRGLAGVMTPGAELIDINKGSDLITVNFSEALLGPDHKAPAEALKAVVLSLTENVSESSKVQILVNGEAKVNATDNQSYSEPVARPQIVNEVKL